MRSRAEVTAAEAHLGVWRAPEQFFKSGGTRDWGVLLESDDLAHFDDRLSALAGEADQWVRHGRESLN
jgi:hypothetical protein